TQQFEPVIHAIKSERGTYLVSTAIPRKTSGHSLGLTGLTSGFTGSSSSSIVNNAIILFSQ
ncbi:hypothetical protein, partial [Pseudomonas aeruginosa]|uniref:hypothetical protein n=1 Tax=Pseudomonas aeruginosa TaxID=287 RepID=UPI0039693903